MVFERIGMRNRLRNSLKFRRIWILCCEMVSKYKQKKTAVRFSLQLFSACICFIVACVERDDVICRNKLQ